jgi:integrase
MAEGVTNENPYLKAKTDKFRGHSKQVFLTPDEIVMFEGFDTENKTLEVVRDRFLYSVYTGLRISDNMALKKSMLTATPDGFVVALHTLKGYGHDLIHPLWLLFDGKPDVIAKKYINTPGECLFPAQSDQTINDGLKIITGILQLKKPVTFHVARHTCATMLAEVTQNPFLMLRLMGWTDVKIAMKYVHGSRESTRRQLDVFKGKWL